VFGCFRCAGCLGLAPVIDSFIDSLLLGGHGARGGRCRGVPHEVGAGVGLAAHVVRHALIRQVSSCPLLAGDGGCAARRRFRPQDPGGSDGDPRSKRRHGCGSVMAGGRLAMSHVLQRPSWLCSCGEAWPCRVRREQLLDEYSGQLPELRAMMAGYLPKALGDALGDVGARHAQLVGWLPPRDRGVSGD
jgi:hypothetical protein